MTAPPKGRIIIIDDDDSLREILGQVLEEWGFEVLTADDGAAVLPLLDAQRPDIVILDWLMPYADVDGAAFLGLVHLFTEHPPEKVFLVSADRWAPEHLDGLKIDGFLEKPFDLTELRSMIMGEESDERR